MEFEMFAKNLSASKVVDINGKFVAIDLSASNDKLAGLDSSEDFERYIVKYLSDHKANAAFGGYSEKRSLYKRSDIFAENGSDRDIHVGIDIWAPAGTSVLAACDGKVHSFDFNTGVGNYGPTIILEHKTDKFSFFTLYGHLSVESIAELEIGDVFKSGDIIGKLGTSKVNGDYAPHLHFQILLDIGDYQGDYPGVCSEADLEYYMKNCPDPNLLLKLN